mgnify:CR=1 FL=1
MSEKPVPIGAVGVALQHIAQGETGLAVFPEIGETSILALETIRKYSQIIVVDKDNKCLEYTAAEKKPRTWNVRRTFTLKPDEEVRLLTIKGEGDVLSIGIIVDGATADAAKTTLSLYHDEEPDPTLKIALADLKILGGNVVPSANPTGGMTVEDTTNYIYAGYINPQSFFRYKLDVYIKNGDPANSTTVDITCLYKLKGTTTEVFVKGGAAGTQGGQPVSPTQDQTSRVGGGGGAGIVAII